MSLERIKEKLSARLYLTIDDFVSDMHRLFEACLSTKDHRYFKTFMQIKDRFERSI